MLYIVLIPRVLGLLVTANFVPSSPILVTLIMEVINSSETLVISGVIQRNISEDGMIQVSSFRGTQLSRCFLPLT
jgi:hypothetical protein